MCIRDSSGTVVGIAVFLMCILEPDFSFMQLFFEVISAFGTVGLSTGITPDLSVAGKAVKMCIRDRDGTMDAGF